MLENPYVGNNDLRVHIETPFAQKMFTQHFLKILNEMYKPSPLLLMCIGTDRSTGDSLGPLVGEKLSNICPHAKVLGNLAEPVHAGNLAKILQEIYETYKDPFIIAVDASLGRSQNVGTIKLARGALKPGAGVNKDLPAVGNFHITGIVNVGGFMEYLVLQNTRLFTVMRMVDIISYGILEGFKQFFE